MNQTLFQVDVGVICITWNLYGLISQIEWVEHGDELLYKSARSGSLDSAPCSVQKIADSLKKYFFRGVPIERVPWELIDRSAWSPFQYKVYSAISQIPHGETRTYGWVAGKLGKASATRAVGQSLRRNPLPILIPCHRVVSVNSLGGFMGTENPDDPEMQLKLKLLSVEQEYLNPLFPFMYYEEEHTDSPQ